LPPWQCSLVRGNVPTCGEIRAIFCAACELLGVRCTASGDKTIYVSRKADVALLVLFVGPKR
jgi:hypothetical protein